MDEAANNIIPLTGSPLSRRSRENISANITSFNSFINEQKNFNAQKTRADDYQNVLIQGGQTSVTSLQSQLEGISREVSSLSQNVNSISQTVAQQSTAEQLRLRAEQENQKRLAERRIAIGKENELEQRIQNSLSSPVLAVQNKVSNLFGRVEQAFTTLFLGWLGTSVIKYLQAQSEGDVNKLDQIKRQILGGLAVGVGALVAVKTGLSLVGRAISAATAGVTSLLAKLISAPFKAIGAGIRKLGGGTPAPRAPGPKPGGKPGGGFGLGKLITGLSMAMNVNNKEYIDATLAGLSLFAKAPGVVGGIAKIAGVAFTLDEISEAFGSNIFGDSRDKVIDEAAQAAKRQKEKQNKNKGKGGSAPTQASPASVSSQQQSTPRTPLTSVPSPTGADRGKPPEGGETQPQAKVQPAATMAPQASDLTMNVNATPSAVPDTAAKEQNVDTGAAPPSAPTTQQFPDYSGIFSSDKPQPKTTPAAQITPPPKDMTKAAALPEVKPNVVVATDTSTASAQSSPPPRPPVNPDTPAISSSNPDNFYVLYSQLNYNIVM